MFCEYCGKQLEENQLCDCPEALEQRKKTSPAVEEVSTDEVLFCEFCGKRLDGHGKCTCSAELEEESILKKQSNSGYKTSKKNNSSNSKILIGIIIAIVLAVGIWILFFSSKDGKEDVTTETTTTVIKNDQEEVVDENESIEDEVDEILDEVESQEIPESQESFVENNRPSIPKDLDFFNLLSDYESLIGAKGEKEILSAIEDVRYAEVNEYPYYSAVYIMEKKEEATASEYTPELYDAAVMVIAKYTNLKTGEEVYGYCVFPNLTIDDENSSFSSETCYVRLENTIDQIRGMLDGDTGYYFFHKIRTKDFITELENTTSETPIWQRMAQMNEYQSQDALIGTEANIFVAISDEGNTLNILDGTGFLDFNLTYSDDASDDNCKIFYAYEDGVELYNKLKDANRQDMISKYKHLDGMNSDQVEKCQIEVFYNENEDSFEFKGVGPFEVFNGVYKAL